MALLPPLFTAQFFADDGAPAAGYLLHTYESGTTTPKATYSNQAGDAENENPIELDAAGRCVLWLGSGEYTFVLATPEDVPVWTRDDVAGVPEATSGSFLPLTGGTMTGPIVLAGNATTALQAVPKQQLDASIAALSASVTAAIAAGITAAAPVGAILLWGLSTPPTGWLHLNGQAVSRATYASLFTLLGTAYGVGDGSTTFNLPDCRGEFLRFWDSSRGVDAGRAIGSAQTEALKAHQHTVTALGDAAAEGRYLFGSVELDEGQTIATLDDKEADTDTAALTSEEGGAETRPRNIAFMAIIKAT